MLNRQNKENRRKENNKGFSLVELIVVIAIMAVLVAVLAPQFTKYIDQSRKSNDAATVSGIVTAAQVGITDVQTYHIPEGKYTITVTKTTSGTTVAAAANDASDTSFVAADAVTAMTNAIKASCGELTGLKVTANAWDTVTITIVYKDGAVDVTYDSDFTDYIK